MARILIADDDPHITRLIALYMKREGHETLEASNGQEALQLLEKKQVQLAIIDLMMPLLDGYQLCETLRDYDDALPILMVTAKGASQDKIKGFQAGTDDYVTKPFDPDELVMRVRALLRRARQQTEQVIHIGDITLDASTKQLCHGDAVLILPLKEFEILFQLASHPQQIFTRIQLIEAFWGLDYEGDERTVDVHIKRIRDKLEDTSVRVATYRGLGYRCEVISS
ncbi:response regulator transcription factor [Marinicrinis sediminis]|uniref:Heme response regulator HssR n=1 Tax=Marinicrinis sediminis TaxID=1652465 RepID=A0ABW5R7R8_9BACL